MNILDENFPHDQRLMLQQWRISTHHIGFDIGREGMQDEEIIPLLHSMRRPTFFTLDFDYYRRRLCHKGYCLVFLNVSESRAAEHVRKLLRHPEFNTEAKHMGAVLRLSYNGLTVWRLKADIAVDILWNE